MTDPDRSANPFFQTWTTPDGAPPFDRIRPEHFRKAYARAFAEHDAEVAAIAAQPEPPDFANTIAALELSGRLLERVGSAFYLLVGAHSDAALLEIEREIAPQLARHWNRINTNEGLFRRIDALMRRADGLDLDAEQKRVLERYHVTFRRAGAALGTASRARLIEIMERLAERGVAIVLMSSELPELLAMADRIIVMRRGTIAGVLDRAEATPEAVMALALGHAA